MTNSIDNYQSALALNEIFLLEGLFPSEGVGTGEFTIGVIRMSAMGFSSASGVFAQGQLLQIADYTAVFSIIGTMYGGNGVNTFALPGLAQASAVGFGQGPGLNAFHA